MQTWSIFSLQMCFVLPTARLLKLQNYPIKEAKFKYTLFEDRFSHHQKKKSRISVSRSLNIEDTDANRAKVTIHF